MMRITNTMMTNTMNLNIYRNARVVNKYYNQMASGKLFTKPSENPIGASRSLKFRTSITETTQYQSNCAQGKAWMDVTDSAMFDVVESMQTLRDLFQGKGASDAPLNYEDKQELVAKIQQYMEHIGTLMNSTYAGRYIFSGTRTDQPAVFTEDNDLVYKITQDFDYKDIEKTSTLYWDDLEETYDTRSINIIKLPYTGVTDINGSPAVTMDFTLKSGGSATNVLLQTVPQNSTSPDPYNPGPNDMYYIPETGEIVIGSATAADLDDFSVTYFKADFKAGELNPQVFFNCQSYEKTPATPPATAGPPYINAGNEYNMDNQDLKFMVGTNTTIKVNTLAKDVYTANLYSDLRALCQAVNDLSIETEDEIRDRLIAANYPADKIDDKVREVYSQQQSAISDVLNDRYSNMIDLMDRHLAQASSENTTLGARMTRFELVENRLSEDYNSYKELLSNVEDVEYMEAATNLMIAEALYQAAMQVGANMIQVSLANFI